MINYSAQLKAVQPALTSPFSFPALQQSESAITGDKSAWVDLQPIMKTDATMNIGNLVEAWYAGLPFWGVIFPTAVL